jgi:hypothetical protein
MTHQLPAFTSCSRLLPTFYGPVTYAEKQGAPAISAGKGVSDMRFSIFADVSEAFTFVRSRTLRLSQHASSEGPARHPGLLRVLELAVRASAKRGAGVRRLRAFPRRRNGPPGDHMRSAGGGNHPSRILTIRRHRARFATCVDALENHRAQAQTTPQSDP